MHIISRYTKHLTWYDSKEEGKQIIFFIFPCIAFH